MIVVSEEEIGKLNEMVGMFKEVGDHLQKGETEYVYQNALIYEFQQRNIMFTKEETIPILYKEHFVGIARLDIVLLSWLPCIIELKAVASSIKPEHVWQLLRYMKIKDMKYGFIVNYNQTPLKPMNVKIVVRGDKQSGDKQSGDNKQSGDEQKAYFYEPHSNTFEKLF